MKAIQTVGALMFFIGASGIDSANQMIPAVMTLTGLAVMYLTSRHEME